MRDSNAIPAWVARRNWNRKNPLWVRIWLDRKPKAGRFRDDRAASTQPSATILPFPQDRRRS